MKLKKKSGLMGAVIALSAASLVSVGFASWIISQGDEETVTGQVFVDTVQNDAHTISAQAIASGDEYISFAAKQNQTAIPNAWLNYSTPDHYENLDVTVTFDVDNVTDDFSEITVAIEATATDLTNYNKAVSEGYIVEPTDKTAGAWSKTNFVAYTGNQAKKDASGTKDLGKGSYTVTFTFNWGEKFGNKNPYEYYNTGKTAAQKPESGADSDKTYAEIAERDLGTLNTYLSNVGFKITITTL